MTRGVQSVRMCFGNHVNSRLDVGPLGSKYGHAESVVDGLIDVAALVE